MEAYKIVFLVPGRDKGKRIRGTFEDRRKSDIAGE